MVGRFAIVSFLIVVAIVSLAHADDQETLKKLFSSLASNHMLGVSPDDLRKGLGHVYADPSASRIRSELFPRLDVNLDGYLSLEEFSRAFVVSSSTSPANSSLPKQIHLALRDAHSMTVMWVTDDALSGAGVSYSLCDNPTSSFFANATTSTYNAGLFGWHKTIYTAYLTNLSPRVTYCYSVGTSSSSSATLHFTMPDVSSAPTARIVMFGDQGTIQPLGFAVAGQVASFCSHNGTIQCDAVQVIGDLAYAWRSVTPGPEEQWIWDLYQQEQQVYAVSIPMMTTVGNHEGFDDQIAYRHRFRMPGPESGGNASIYYSYDVGPVHVIAISTEEGNAWLPPASPQFKWLIDDLTKTIARTPRPWIVVTNHRPMYSSDSFELSQHVVGAPIQANLEPVLLKFGVDLMVVGHSHTYERILPLVAGKPVVPINSTVYHNPQGCAHVVQGTGGAYYDDKWTNPQPNWSASRAIHYGIGVLEANSTVLHYSFYLEKDGSLFDEFYISRS